MALTEVERDWLVVLFHPEPGECKREARARPSDAQCVQGVLCQAEWQKERKAMIDQIARFRAKA